METRLICNRVQPVVPVQVAPEQVNVDKLNLPNEMVKKASLKNPKRALIDDYPIISSSLSNAYGSSYNTPLSCFNNITPTIFSTKSFTKKKKNNNNDFSYKNSIEYKTLIQRYSSGVRLPELCSLAKILSSILPNVLEPTRDERRSFPLLIEWFHNFWDLIFPVLPFLQLRDENYQVIDGRRELIDKYLNSK